MDASNDEENAIQNYFDGDEWIKVSTFEKKRYINMKKNYEIMESAGLNPKLPEFMLPRKKIQTIMNSKVRHKTDVQGSAKKCSKKELWNKMLQINWGRCKLKLTPRRKEAVSVLLEKTQKNLKCIKELLISDNMDTLEKRDSKSERRYPKRKIPRVSYAEEVISNVDDFLFCDDCGHRSDGECPVHGRMLLDFDRKAVPCPQTICALDTCPSFLSVCPSGIRGVRLGVWTEIPLPIGIVFGPYHEKVVKKRKRTEGRGLAWEVRYIFSENLQVLKGGSAYHYMDSSHLTEFNWMRFVNCAQYEEQQNLVAFQYDGKVFYKTYKRVPPYTELLVWYGDQYASDIWIDLWEDQPPKDQTEGSMNAHRLQPTTGSISRRSLLTWTKNSETVKYHSSPNTSERCIRNFKDITSEVRNPRIKEKIREFEVSGETFSVECSLEARGKACAETHHAESYSNEYQPRKRRQQKRPGAMQDDETNKKLQCCDYMTSDLMPNQHVRGNRTKNKPHKRPNDECRTPQFGDFKKHTIEVFNGLDTLKCPHCEFKTSQCHSLKKHIMANHDGLKPHKCPHCEYRVRRYWNLKRHMSIHEGQIPHKCPHCEYRARQDCNLKRHIMSIHEGQTPNKCPHCEYRARHYCNLKRHIMSIHEGQKSHKCLHCEYSSAYYNNVKRHIMAIHEGQKLYKCPHCEHRTAQSSNLKIHIMAIHGGQKTHK